jgi:uroporphyrinogen-III decarboxylase
MDIKSAKNESNKRTTTVFVAMFLKQRKFIQSMNMNDQMLIDYVRRMINTGARTIFVPMYLVNNASHEVPVEDRESSSCSAMRDPR